MDFIKNEIRNELFKISVEGRNTIFCVSSLRLYEAAQLFNQNHFASR